MCTIRSEKEGFNDKGGKHGPQSSQPLTSKHEMGTDKYVGRKKGGYGVGVRFINPFVSFLQRSLFKGLSHIFSPFGQEPVFMFVGYQNDLGSQWLDDNHTGTNYRVCCVKDTVQYHCSGPLR